VRCERLLGPKPFRRLHAYLTEILKDATVGAVLGGCSAVHNVPSVRHKMLYDCVRIDATAELDREQQETILAACAEVESLVLCEKLLSYTRKEFDPSRHETEQGSEGTEEEEREEEEEERWRREREKRMSDIDTFWQT